VEIWALSNTIFTLIRCGVPTRLCGPPTRLKAGPAGKNRGAEQIRKLIGRHDFDRRFLAAGKLKKEFVQ